ncbi:immediate early response gene 2 protein-like, partial [Tigriopus californicus]|uniref:immediate early response gene 2 protein-like n=1 Tax=Tigriopus californicus TaxID=6832 RepID=UPI0027DA6AB9
MNMQGGHHSDFPSKMSSLSEVQRIIGLSLSKIQLGRNQRGGLPLHKNLLVATVLNKARDLYMQETMYMNYKMMTGQYHQHHPMSSYTSEFALNSSNSMANGMHHSPTGEDEDEEEDDDMETTPSASTTPEDYDEDNEDSDHSDVEDESPVTRSRCSESGGVGSGVNHGSATGNHVQQQQQQQQQHDMSLMFQQH